MSAAKKHLEDEDFVGLLADAQRGSGSAWEQLFGWLSPAVAGYMRVQGAIEVDDLVSDVFLGVFRNIAGFEGTQAQFRSWVFVIAHHRLVDDRRRRTRDFTKPYWDTPEPRDYKGSGDETATEALDRMAGSTVVELCERLAPDQRDVLLLRIVADLTIEQIAEAIGKSTGAVKALQRRGLSSLRTILSRQAVPL